MALGILSHSALWDGFKIKGEVNCEKIDERTEGRVLRERSYVLCDGELSGVKVFLELVRKKGTDNAPAVLILNTLGNREDEKLTETLLSFGYIVANVDIEGKFSGKEYYTVYPENLDFANFNGNKKELYSGFESEKKVCWFIWTKALYFVVKYLSALPFVNGIGGIASGEIATSLWQLSSVSQELDCAVFVGNAGWQSYRGYDKFLDAEPNFSDEELAVVADIEAQSYANHVKCPCLLLSALGDEEFDVDRAYDTMARISERLYKATLYSFKRKSASTSAVQVIKLFFSKFLKKEKVELAGEPKLSVGTADGKLVAEITLPTKAPASVRFYYSTDDESPAKRYYETVVPEEIKEGAKYRATVSLPKEVKRAIVFASVRYENGYGVCSNVEAVNFENGGDGNIVKSGIIYASRDSSRSIFFPKNEEFGASLIDFNENNAIKKLSGPMGVGGVYCKNGLLTFKTHGKGGKIRDDAMLLFDAFGKEDAELKVSLIAIDGGTQTEYLDYVHISGSASWQNFKLDVRGFKTVDGMPLKNLDRIDAIAFESDSDKEYIVNNILWV